MDSEIESKLNITNKTNELFCIIPNKVLTLFTHPLGFYVFPELDAELKRQMIKQGDEACS